MQKSATECIACGRTGEEFLECCVTKKNEHEYQQGEIYRKVAKPKQASGAETLALKKAHEYNWKSQK